MWLVNAWSTELFAKVHLKKASDLALLLLGFVLLVGCQRAPQLDAKRPNILLIVVDCLRADRLGLYGHSRPTSPNIDRLAENAIVFDRAFSHAPWTPPSMATLFTSTYESVHRISPPMFPESRSELDVLDGRFETMAEFFQKTGYRTGGVVSSDWVSEETSYDQGFDDFMHMSGVPRRTEAERITLTAIDWLRKNRDQKTFLYLHYLNAHDPYNPPDLFKDRWYEGTDSERDRFHEYQPMERIQAA